MSKIGICDWGIGGLGVYKALREAQITADVVYFSDSGFTPYGKVSKEVLTQRWIEVKAFFEKKKVDRIIVACNALSTVVREDDCTTTMAAAVRRLVRAHKNDEIGIIGGVRTIESKMYDLGFGHQFRIAQPLSALVEKGILEGENVEEEIQQVMKPISNLQVVILACTHYPVLMPVFNKMYPTIEFIDPSSEIASRLNPVQGEERLTVFTTGDVRQTDLTTQKAWKIESKVTTKVTI